MRVAFFGGTFDPPHNGHLAVALAAADAFALDRVLLAPVGAQPLKPHGPRASYVDRFAMIELLAQSDSRLYASALDAPRADGTPNYSIDTLTALRASVQPQNELYNIVGIDSFADLQRWREPKRLLQAAEWIVVSRPGLELHSIIASVVPPEFRPRIHELGSVNQDISATEIRRRLRLSEACDGMLTPAVLAYIQAHELYR